MTDTELLDAVKSLQVALDVGMPEYSADDCDEMFAEIVAAVIGGKDEI